MSQIKNKELSSHFVGIVLFIGLFLPHQSFILMAIPPLMYFMLARKSKRHEHDSLAFLFCFSTAVTLAFCLLKKEEISSKSLLEWINLLLLFLLFPAVNQCKIKKIYFYVFISIIILSQLVYILNISAIVNLIESLYPIGDESSHYEDYIQENIDVTNITSFRLSGIFRNPNQTARYVTLIIAIFLSNSLPNKLKTAECLFMIASFGSVFLTGSRTGFIIASLLVIYYFYNIQLRKGAKVGIILLISIILILIIGNGVNVENYRSMMILDGIDNSAKLKLETFIDYLGKESSLTSLLFGHFDALNYHANAGVLNIFDAEYGYGIYKFGFAGFGLLVIFVISCFVHTPRKQRIFFIVFMWCITSTIFFSFRMSLVTTICLSLLYRSKKL